MCGSHIGWIETKLTIRSLLIASAGSLIVGIITAEMCANSLYYSNVHTCSIGVAQVCAFKIYGVHNCRYWKVLESNYKFEIPSSLELVIPVDTNIRLVFMIFKL